ncbi:hypothetical protein ACFC09_40160, partial [Streptomyces sp. NPDC056161]|uniref:hypothetical protein n=1 Tax=Streptomyces sp. NPDC056161 TaxID=3345732 RepID=UPI0035D858D2
MPAEPDRGEHLEGYVQVASGDALAGREVPHLDAAAGGDREPGAEGRQHAAALPRELEAPPAPDAGGRLPHRDPAAGAGRGEARAGP